MVITFVRLKLRLMRNRLRKSGPISILAFAFVWLGGARVSAPWRRGCPPHHRCCSGRSLSSGAFSASAGL